MEDVQVVEVVQQNGPLREQLAPAFSAAVNIVEGSARPSRREFRRFLDIALASLTEVGYALRFCKETGILREEDWVTLDDRQNRARFLTWQLYQSLAPK